MKRLLINTAKTFITIIASMIVLLAIVVGIARELVVEVDDFQNDLIAYFNEKTGLVLEFDRVVGSWRGLAPKFELEHVRLRSASVDDVGITADSMVLEVLLLRSLIHLQPRVRLIIDGARLTSHIDNNRLIINGFEFKSDHSQPANPRRLDHIIDFLISQPLIEFRDSILEINDLYDQRVSVHVKEFQSEAGVYRRYMKGSMTVSGPSTLQLNVVGRVKGSFLKRGSLEGDLYVETEQANWLPWIPKKYHSFHQANIEGLMGGAKAWFRFRGGVADEIISDFFVDDFKLSSTNKIEPPQIEKMEGTFRWVGQWGQQWEMALQDFKLETSQFKWRPTVLHVQANHQPDLTQEYKINANDIDIKPWTDYFLGIQPTDSQWYQAIDNLRPSGRVQNLYLGLTVKDQHIVDHRFSLELKQFRNKPWEKYPGFHDLDVQILGKEDQYLFHFDEDYLELTYPYLFRDVLTLDQFSANLRLKVTDESYDIQSDDIQIRTEHVKTATQFSLSVPKDRDIAPFIQLQSTLRSASAQNKSLYLPSGVLSESLLRWLDTAIVDGQLLRGDIVVHGPLRRHQIEPFKVLLGFTVDDATLQFLPEWQQPVTGLVGDVLIDRGEVDAQVLQGNYFDQALQKGHVWFPRIEGDAAHELFVSAVTKGNASSGIDVLKKTPLRDHIGDFVDQASLKGDLGVALDLVVPLQSDAPKKLSANADITLKNGTLRLDDQNIELTQLQGAVNYNIEKGLNAEDLTGIVFGGQIRGGIATSLSESASSMDISLTGKTHSDAIKTWLPLSILTPIDGVLSYQFGLHLPLKRKGGEAGSPYLLVRSDLTGASVELPAPFGKDPASKKPFSIKVDLNQTPTPIHIAYGKQLKVALKTQDHQLQRAHIQLGGDDARMPASDAIEIRGMLERFDSTQWMAVLDTLNASAQQSTDPNSPSILTQIDNSSVYVDNLIIEDKNWGGTTVAVNQLGDVWNLNVKNDSVTGNAKVPFGVLASDWGRSNPKQNIDVRLKHLTIIKSEQTQENTEWEPLALSPKTLPSASVVIDKFQLGKANFGRWNIIAKPTQQGMDLKADVRMSGLSAKGIGQWFQPDGKEPATHVNVDLKGKNAADIMQTMGFEPALTSEAAIGNADLRWPGSPIDFSLQRAQGELSVDVENGRFLNVNSNAAGKLWGALNFETLLRRVQLDFTDLSESEMVYDEINGAMTLMPGVLTLDNVDLNSPALKLKLDGDIDLKQDTLNLGMDVTVPITRNLVLPAAVIGGVPAAATAFVVEKVLGSQLDKLTTIKYRIEGSFDEPKVRAKDSFSLFPKQVSDSAISNSPLKTTDPAGATP